MDKLYTLTRLGTPIESIVASLVLSALLGSPHVTSSPMIGVISFMVRQQSPNVVGVCYGFYHEVNSPIIIYFQDIVGS
jgi:hypothetical protein